MFENFRCNATNSKKEQPENRKMGKILKLDSFVGGSNKIFLEFN